MGLSKLVCRGASVNDRGMVLLKSSIKENSTKSHFFVFYLVITRYGSKKMSIVSSLEKPLVQNKSNVALNTTKRTKAINLFGYMKIYLILPNPKHQ